jgi:V/A-type H+-transporting ATPase subunit E
MAGLEDILNIIDSQQKETESRIMSSAESKVREINKDAAAKADKAYSDYMKKAEAENLRSFESSCVSVDAEMKRRILKCKVGLIDEVIEKTLQKLRSQNDADYFTMLEKLITRSIRKDDGTVSLSSKDLGRLPAGFEDKLKAKAAEIGGSIKIDTAPADIEDGFILTYGLISENCSFSAILETERESIKDLASTELFRQVSK